MPAPSYRPHIQAATYRLLTLIRELDEASGWSCGFRSCAHWLNWPGGRLEPEVGVALMRVLEAANDGLYEESKAKGVFRGNCARPNISFSQRTRNPSEIVTGGAQPVVVWRFSS